MRRETSDSTRERIAGPKQNQRSDAPEVPARPAWPASGLPRGYPQISDRPRLEELQPVPQYFQADNGSTLRLASRPAGPKSSKNSLNSSAVLMDLSCSRPANCFAFGKGESKK